MEGNRRELLSVLGQEMLINAQKHDFFPIIPISNDDLYIIWEHDPKKIRSLPSVIIVSEGKEKDFLAWAITYFPNYKPFTAYFRISELKKITKFDLQREIPSLDKRVGTACLGIILSETILLSNQIIKYPLLNPINCTGTLSFLLSRALAVGADSDQLDSICERWSILRNIIGNKNHNIESSFIKDLFLIIYSLNESEYDYLKESIHNLETVAQACSDILLSNRVSDDIWLKLSNGTKELEDAHKIMAAPREERIKYFEYLIKIESFSKITDKFHREFIIGYLGSLIGPGSLSHYELMSQYFDSSPKILIWYGLCAGLQKKNDLINSFNILGRRVLRELLKKESILDTPTADISFLEFQLLLEGDIKITDFRTFASTRVNIEILPGVNGNFAWPRKEFRNQVDLFTNPEEMQNKDNLLKELSNHLTKALDIQKALTNKRYENKPRVKSKKHFNK